MKEMALRADTAESAEELLGIEGNAARLYFGAFDGMLKAGDEANTPAGFQLDFEGRNRRPPRDPVNALLSLGYSMLTKDLTIACYAVGFDPMMGYYHQPRFGRPALALDLMEEFRPWLADRLAITLINRQQISAAHFVEREGGVVEFTEAGRKLVIRAYQERKQDSLTHPLLEQNLRLAQMPFIQARILARHLREDLPEYLPLLPK